MKGYRNILLVVLAIATSTFLAWAGIRAGSDLIGLSAVIGAKDAGVAAMIFGRGYNKKAEAMNGGVQ